MLCVLEPGAPKKTPVARHKTREAFTRYRRLNSYSDSCGLFANGNVRTAATSSALKQKVWVVPKSQLPEIPAALQKAVLDPSTLDQLPPGLARDEAHFLDQVISRTDLPVGTMEWEVSVGVTKTAKNLSEQAALPEIPAQQHDVAPIPASASTEGQSGAPRALTIFCFFFNPLQTLLMSYPISDSFIEEQVAHKMVSQRSRSLRFCAHDHQMNPRRTPLSTLLRLV